VAEMREKSGFPSPCSRSLRGRSSSWRDDLSTSPTARGFNFPSVMCGMDESYLADLCCTGTHSRFGKEPKVPSNYTSRLCGRPHDDSSTHCESTVESFEQPLNRCSSSGRAMDKRHESKPLDYQRPDLNVVATDGLVPTNSTKAHVYLAPTGAKQGMRRGTSSGQIFDGATSTASAEATSVGLHTYRSDLGMDYVVDDDDNCEDDLQLNTLGATKWKPSKRISRPVCPNSSTQLPRPESYNRRSKPAVNAQQEVDDL
jgi:hypothetical protein